MSIIENKTGQLWKSFMTRRSEFSDSQDTDLYSIQLYPENYNPSDLKQVFTKWAAIKVTDHNNIPKGMSTIMI